MNQIYLEKASANAIIPTKGTTHAACYDLYADVNNRTITVRTDTNVSQEVYCLTSITLAPNTRALIPTGWKMQCPQRMSIDFLPRSGTAWKEGLTVINSPGVIDHDYSDECFVAVINHSNVHVTINTGDRIAQMRLVPVLDTELDVVDELPLVASTREGGFGSTGV